MLKRSAGGKKQKWQGSSILPRHVMWAPSATPGRRSEHLAAMGSLSKRSVVKHRTRTGDSAPKRGGFSVGATHAPSGAYIGHAKKHKADLIHKAKVKKAYYKMLQHEGRADGAAVPAPPQDLGRFAPEEPEAEDNATPAPAPAAPAAKKKLPYFYRPPAPRDAPREAAPRRTRDEALAARDAQRAKWHRTSPSRLGRERGQPDLGARVEVMLDRIRQSRPDASSTRSRTHAPEKPRRRAPP